MDNFRAFPNKEFYRLDECADLLRVSYRTIRRMTDDGRLEARRIGKRALRVHQDALFRVCGSDR